MIKSVTIINNKNEQTTIQLSNPSPSGLLITNIDGLDSPVGTINMIERTQLNGSVYNGSRANARNIVLSLRYFEGNTNADSIEDIRHNVYRIFPIGEYVTLIVTTDNRQVYFYGYVETNEVNIFDEYEGSQVSILCEEPYGKGEENQLTDFSGINSLFEFPFSNESTDLQLIEFGEVYSVMSRRVDYEGEAQTGFTLTIKFREDVDGIKVENLTTDQAMIIDEPFTSGDVLEVCTIAGQKHATLNDTNIIGSFYTTASNDWVELLSGDNYVKITDKNGNDTIETSMAYVECPILYMGV